MQPSYERRKYHRLPIELHLEINHMFRQNYEMIENMETDISVFDISKSGLGFISIAKLPVDFYFNAKIRLKDEDFFYAVVKIVRESTKEDGEWIYGAEFIGLAPFLADKIDVYEKGLQSVD